jgi:hypothetical protein
MDIKLEQFWQKSGFTNTHISEKVHIGFFSNFAKKLLQYMDYNLPFLGKLNFASFQNGGFAQNGHKISFLSITESILKNFMFSLLILVNGHIPHKS